MVDQNLIENLRTEEEQEAQQMLAEAYGEEVANGEFDALLDQQGRISEFKPGSILTGKIIGMAGDDFVVELGLKSEGVLDKNEFDEPENVEIGDEVEVLLEDVEGDTGMVVISKRKADRIRSWETIMNTKKEGDPVKGKVTRRSRAACWWTSACRCSCPPPRWTSAGRATSATSSARPSTP